MREDKLADLVNALMEKVKPPCKNCDAFCCKQQALSQLYIVVDESAEREIKEKNPGLISYLKFEIGKEEYVVRKPKIDASNINIFGVDKDYTLKTNNGILEIPIMGVEVDPIGKTGRCKALTPDNKCSIHSYKPLLGRLFPFMLVPNTIRGTYNSVYFTGTFSLFVVPCKDMVRKRAEAFSKRDKEDILQMVREILRLEPSYLVRLTALFDLKQNLVRSYENTKRNYVEIIV